jgi:hypothetical protein
VYIASGNVSSRLGDNPPSGNHYDDVIPGEFLPQKYCYSSVRRTLKVEGTMSGQGK